MSRKVMKLSAVAGGANAPVAPLGAASVLAVVAGVAAVVGASALHKRRAAAATAAAAASDAAQVAVGLLRVHVPQNFRDLVKNDVLVEKAVESVARSLVIFVAGRDKHEIVNYTSELYSLVWDVACLQGKPLLDIRIVSGFADAHARSWGDLVLLPELNAVFGEDALVDVQRLNAQRFERDGLFAVTYHPLAMHIERRLSPEFKYFENEHTDLTPHDVVILGGTFDHLHNGHKKLLSLAVSICARRIVVGVTADKMLVHKSHAALIEPLARRQQSVRDYVAFLKPHVALEVVTIEDPFGPAITIPEPAAIVVSTETVAGATKINTIRVERALPKVHIFVCRRTESSTLSSSYIRERLAAAASTARS
ncbi:hypothetical protein PybrP1_007987 [[Pythium] brassicae (nom. inval.)]|nr:hypothetical protein PybrP1_007987 [[Pythium] brassicae (nom. inval.)]